MKKVETVKKSLRDYEALISAEKIEEIESLSRELKGARVLHINATAYGGGVAEILHTLVPLMNDAGLVADWAVIEAPGEFFELTKRMHNALQGKDDKMNKEDKELFLRVTRENAQRYSFGAYDYVIIHDPQPVGLPEFVDFGEARLVWRCHIDTSSPNMDFWSFLNNHLGYYDAGVFTLRDYAKDGISINNIVEIPPSIDPLSNKNRALRDDELKLATKKLRVDVGRPIISQVSRFDPWKDPMGVVDVYRVLKEEFKGLQLLMIGAMASDDPEGWEIYDDLLRYAGTDYDIKVLSNFHGVAEIEVNAAQRISNVVLQKSIREGFALTMSEAMWKKTPVIGGNVGGIPLQVKHGVNGYLVNSIEETAEYTAKLLRDKELAREFGEKGHEIVKEHFLVTRHLVDYMRLFKSL
ncbi:MAG: Glycosyltransferase [Thermotogales bacterium 46_20]|nr:MAG: Glycosyltransferase [Thermotogales bacterium 46_20]